LQQGFESYRDWCREVLEVGGRWVVERVYENEGVRGKEHFERELCDGWLKDKGDGRDVKERGILERKYNI